MLPDEVRDVAPDCLRHRLMFSYEASADRIAANTVVDPLLQQVAVAWEAAGASIERYPE